MLTDQIKKIKQFGVEYKDEIFITFCVILVGTAGFGLGRLSKIIRGRVPIQIEQPNRDLGAPHPSNLDAEHPSKKSFVGSKNATKYHFPWCPGALKIRENNKVWFEDRQAAERAGYTKAANCAGL